MQQQSNFPTNKDVNVPDEEATTAHDEVGHGRGEWRKGVSQRAREDAETSAGLLQADIGARVTRNDQPLGEFKEDNAGDGPEKTTGNKNNVSQHYRC